MYQTHGSSDTAAASLDKAAKIIEQHSAEQALELYKRAADIAMVRMCICKKIAVLYCLKAGFI